MALKWRHCDVCWGPQDFLQIRILGAIYFVETSIYILKKLRFKETKHKALNQSRTRIRQKVKLTLLLCVRLCCECVRFCSALETNLRQMQPPLSSSHHYHHLRKQEKWAPERSGSYPRSHRRKYRVQIQHQRLHTACPPPYSAGLSESLHGSIQS